MKSMVRGKLNKGELLRCGFTLIELLVVISVIAVLMSIMLPSLTRAREQSKRVVCGSNIRQLYLANTGYAMENGGEYVLAAEDIWGSNLLRWHGERDSVNEAFDPSRSPLVGYLGGGAIKECPGFRKYFGDPGQVNAGFEAGCGGYGYNDQYVGGRADLYGLGRKSCEHSAKICDLKRPGETVMFTDSAFVNTTGDGKLFIEYSFCEAPYVQIAAGAEISDMMPNPTIHFRHFGTTSVVWVDGHVGWEKMSFSGAYSTHARGSEEEIAKLGLGWFGPEDNSLFDLR